MFDLPPEGGSYRTPAIRFLIGLTSANITTLATSSTIVTSRKRSWRGIVLKNPAAHPASLLPNAFDRNHTPIIRPTMRTGDSFVTTLRPTGLTHNSPSSEIAYAQNSHHGLTRTPSACAAVPAGTRIRNDSPMNSTPMANLPGTDGPRLPSRIQSSAKSGASRMTRTGCTVWNHDEGNEKPKTSSRV